MKRSSAIASLLLASTLVVPALAEDAAKPGSGGQIQTDAATDNGTTASTGVADFETLIASIEADSTNVGAISSLTTVGSLKVVRAVDLAKGENMDALEKAITDNQAAISGLQTAMTANRALKAKLDAQKVAASTILAADIEPDGSLTVYVK
jgi:hypothetical protein